jgi:hypothetical protein
MFIRLALSAALVAASSAAFAADPAPLEGYLCCNMRTDGKWISDINYVEAGKRVLSVGTPLKVTGYGRHRAFVDIGDTKQALGNDYSRDLPLEAFARRYVVAEDPKTKMAKFPARIQEAIKDAKLLPGMTREQVLMAVGYPVTSENPQLDAKVWRFWLDSFAEFQVVFDASDRVKEIDADSRVRRLVVAE